MSLRFFAVCLLAGGLLFFAATANAAEPVPVESAAPAGDAPAPLLLAERKGPIIWQLDDETKRAMDNDMELWRLYGEAQAAKSRRKAIGLGTFIPGAIMVAAGFIGGLFQNAIGLYKPAVGDVILVVGVAGGLPLCGVGIYFTGFKSQAEKDYDKYVMDKYKVYPIMRITPLPNKGMMASFGARF